MRVDDMRGDERIWYGMRGDDMIGEDMVWEEMIWDEMIW